MPRPQKQRKIAYTPSVTVFKPAGIPFRDIEEVQLSLDELEAIRLAHVEGLYQAGVSERMGISRQTAGRILDSAHQKIAHALVEGKAIRIEGGVFRHTDDKQELCETCGEPLRNPLRRRTHQQGLCRCRRRSKIHTDH